MKQRDAAWYGVVLLPKGGLCDYSIRATRRACSRDFSKAWDAAWPTLRSAGYRIVPVNLTWASGAAALQER